MKSLRAKLVFVGDGACGKSCLLYTFINGKYPQIYTPTVFENYVADIKVNDKQLELAIWDTCGLEDYDKLRTFSYPGTDVMILCFSIDNPSSLKSIIEKWSPDAKEYCPGTPFIVVGLKKDLRTNGNVIEDLKKRNEEPVTEAQGRLIADKVGAKGYVECSALKNEGVHEVFKMAAEVTLKARKNKKKCTIL